MSPGVHLKVDGPGGLNWTVQRYENGRMKLNSLKRGTVHFDALGPSTLDLTRHQRRHQHRHQHRVLKNLKIFRWILSTLKIFINSKII